MKEETLQAIATNVPDLDKVIHDPKPEEEWDGWVVEYGETSRVLTLPDGPVRVKVIEHDPDGPGFRWLWKEGSALRPFQDRDVVQISREMQYDLIEKGSEEEAEWIAEKYRIDRRMVFVARRQNRHCGWLVMFFEGEDRRRGGWNLEQLKKAGFEFTEPDYRELSLIECPTRLLDEKELVLRELMTDTRVPGRTDDEVDAEAYLRPVIDAMRKHGIVFYRP